MVTFDPHTVSMISIFPKTGMRLLRALVAQLTFIISLQTEKILKTEDQVVDAWKALLARVTERSSKLGQSDEYQRFIIAVQNLLLWIQDMRIQIESDESPRYVFS